MTPSQLRQWSFQNSQPDQWWLCLDSVTEEVPVTVAEIESLLASGNYAQAQVLHTSQAETANPAWINLTMPATFATPPSVDTAMAALSQSAKAQNAPTNAPTNAQANTPNKDMQQGCLALIGLVAFLFVIFKGFSWVTGEQSSSNDVPVAHAMNEVTTSSANLWYEGGTLTNAKMSEWSSASYANRLATSADFVARMEHGQWDKFESVDEIRPLATRLERAITATNRNGSSNNLYVSEVAATCWLLIRP